MKLLIQAARFVPYAKQGCSQSLSHFSRRMSTETPGMTHPVSTSTPTIGPTIGPWDPTNRIRIVGVIIGVTGAVGMLFDTFYRRATKQELHQAMGILDAKIDLKIDKLKEKLDSKIDKLNEKLNLKLDGLTNALLHTNQCDKIAAETENRELRREIERLKGKETQT